MMIHIENQILENIMIIKMNIDMKIEYMIGINLILILK